MEPTRRRIPGLIPGLIVGGAVALLSIAIEWDAVFVRRVWSTRGSEFLIAPALCAVILLPIASLRAFLVCGRSRRRAFAIALASLVTIALTLVGLRVGASIRHAGFERLARDAQPLIDAIESHTIRHGSPPGSLAMLSAGLTGDLPRFRYDCDASTPSEHFGNLWALSLATPSGWINFDRFLYLPLQNYPQRGYGGWLQRIGRWAYVHE